MLYQTNVCFTNGHGSWGTWHRWFQLASGETYYRRKAPLVIGGARTQLISDSVAIAATALNCCTTLTCNSMLQFSRIDGIMNLHSCVEVQLTAMKGRDVQF